TSAPRAASATLAQITPPAEANLSRVAAVRLYPTTSNPARARLEAIGRPMTPSPMKPILVMVISPLLRASLLQWRIEASLSTLERWQCAPEHIFLEVRGLAVLGHGCLVSIPLDKHEFVRIFRRLIDVIGQA